MAKAMYKTQPNQKYYFVTLGWRLARQSHVSVIALIVLYTFEYNRSLPDFYREQLLYDSPPTYRGVNIKYFYRITIATQRVGSKVQTLNIPIRVLPLPISMRPEEITALCDETNEELTPSNPFMDNKRTESYLEVAMDYLQNITARRRPNFYVISNLRGKVGRFCLFKSDYRLGEDIVGSLDFTERTVRCVQFSVTLQCEEILARKKLQVVEPKEKTEEGEKNEAATSLNLEMPASGKITSYSKHHDVCLGFLQTQMILPIPLHVTPSFKTDLGECNKQILIFIK
jgi:RAB6A-GEF complex partner protein 2